jgi:hypothetical protein
LPKRSHKRIGFRLKIVVGGLNTYSLFILHRICLVFLF